MDISLTCCIVSKIPKPSYTDPPESLYTYRYLYQDPLFQEIIIEQQFISGVTSNLFSKIIRSLNNLE